MRLRNGDLLLASLFSSLTSDCCFVRRSFFTRHSFNEGGSEDGLFRQSEPSPFGLKRLFAVRRTDMFGWIHLNRRLIVLWTEHRPDPYWIISITAGTVAIVIGILSIVMLVGMMMRP